MRPTAFTGRMGVQHPLVLAPMAGGPSTPALCAAVSEAGALGSHGGAYLAPAKLRDDIRAIRAATSRPFAINLFTDDGAAGDERILRAAQDAVAGYRALFGLPPAAPPAPPVTLREAFPVILEERVPVFSFTFGIPPREMLDACRKAGIATMGTATTVAEARALEQSGVDFICAQGAEAGGHRGTFDRDAEPPLIGTLALVPQVVDAVRLPVIRAAAAKLGDPGFLSLWAGQAAALAHEMPARELVAQIVHQAEAVISGLRAEP